MINVIAAILFFKWKEFQNSQHLNYVESYVFYIYYT